MVFLSCTYHTPETTTTNENTAIDTFSADTALKSEPQLAVTIADTIIRFVVDDYPVTNAMLADKTSDNSSLNKRQLQATIFYLALYIHRFDTKF
jgi:hypothetical protein